MYLLFRYHHIMPSDYYWRKTGEKKIIRGFISREMDDRKKEVDALKG